MYNLGSPKVQFDPIRTTTCAVIAAAGALYQVIGAKYQYPIRLLKITNKTNADLVISFDGIDAHDIIPMNSYCLYDFGSNMATQTGHLELQGGTQVYARCLVIPGAPAGSLYITAVCIANRN
jgi:hypothetical protein